MKRRWRWILGLFVLVTVVTVVFVRAHPLVFNESFWSHAYYIKIAGFELDRYAEQNSGKFPVHPQGYGNALLLLNEDCYWAFTGPGYDDTSFHNAKSSGHGLAEQDCGRVYVQGLTGKSNPKIAILFDKLPTPGGDHSHFPERLWAPLGREVLFVDSHFNFVAESNWPEFAKTQVELLVKEGMKREEAERFYASEPKPN